jgi:hypothetical protein
MKRLQNHLIGIDQGEVVLFSHFENDGQMWSGEGAREARKTVSFQNAFRKPPAVQVSVSLWDVHGQSPLRAEVTAQTITESTCDIVFKTWADSRIARIRVAWMAIGELPHEDDWELY